MGVAYYIVLDTKEPGFDTSVNGNFIAQEIMRIGSICKKLSIRELDEFVSMSGDEIEDLLGEKVKISVNREEGWFAPDEGITVFSALIKHVKTNPKDIKNPQGVLEDLLEYLSVLEKAKNIGAKWHFNIDI